MVKKIHLNNIETVEEFNNYLEEKFLKYYKRKNKKIKKRISKMEDYFRIDNYNVSYDNFINSRESKIYCNYLKNLNFEYIDNGIKILVLSDYFWNDIKHSIPSNITKLEVPFSLIKDDLSFLNSFCNLNTLIIEETLTNEEIKLIYEKTNIRNIYTDSLIEYRDFYKEEDFAIAKINKYSSFVIYKDLIIRKKEEIGNLISNKESLFIEIYNLDIDKIKRLFELSNSRGISEIVIYIYGSNYLDLDFTFLEELNEKYNLSFKYGSYERANIDEFKSLAYCINWYKEIINESNLSPVEKVMYAFDIVKSWEYKENLFDKSVSREPHKIIQSGNIVCVGYCKLLKLILCDLDENIECGSFGVSCFAEVDMDCFGHERCIVKVDDEKYNIHGIYVLDPTWDSVTDSFKNIVKEEYNGLDLYRYFLIPSRDYASFFPSDSIPEFLMCYLDEKYENVLKEYSYIFEKNIKVGITASEIIKYLSVERIFLEEFNEMLKNVRVAEGYSDEESLMEIIKVNSVNKKIIDIEKKLGNDMEFFKPKKYTMKK